MKLADELLAREPSSVMVLRDGIVTAASPLTVTIPPSTVASRATALDSYAPVASDFVQVLVQGANRLVIGSAGRTTAWTTVALATNWANLGGGYQGAEYRRIGDLVFMRGVVANGTSGTTITTLPAGYRPPAHLILSTWTADNVAPQHATRMIVNTTGAVVVDLAAFPIAHVSLDCQFSVST